MAEVRSHRGGAVAMIGNQMSFYELKRHLGTSRVAIGTAGEQLVARALERNGYQIATNHDHGDLRAFLANGDTINIEVKTARRGKRGHYNFTLQKCWQGRQCCDHRDSDLVIFLCVLKTGDAIPFVVPVGVVGNRRAASVSSYPLEYRGWLSPWRQPLEMINLERAMQ